MVASLPVQHSEKHTLHTALKKYRLLLRQQLKTSVLTGHFWFSLYCLPCTLPAWPEAPQEGVFPPSSASQHQGQRGSALVFPAHCHSKHRQGGLKWNLDKYVLYIQLPPNTGTVITSPFFSNPMFKLKDTNQRYNYPHRSL